MRSSQGPAARVGAGPWSDICYYIQVRWRASLSLALRNLVFIFILPAAGAVYGPWWVLTRNGASRPPFVWQAVVLIVLGVALYLWCVWAFASLGRGTPAPWDAPRHLVAVGPYRFVRNPIYVSAFMVIGGEAWLFRSLPLVIYLAVATLGVYLYVLAFEEPALARRFGQEYETYRRTVPRWLPRLRSGSSS